MLRHANQIGKVVISVETAILNSVSDTARIHVTGGTGGLGLLFGLQRVNSCLIQLVAINCINIAVNLILVIGLGMKIEGVALATVLAQYTGTGVTAWLVIRAVGHPWDWPWPPVREVVSLSALAGGTGAVARRASSWWCRIVFMDAHVGSFHQRRPSLRHEAQHLISG